LTAPLRGKFGKNHTLRSVVLVTSNETNIVPTTRQSA
jgi:hypothetical protein